MRTTALQLLYTLNAPGYYTHFLISQLMIIYHYVCFL